jgi:hypothetical protein
MEKYVKLSDLEKIIEKLTREPYYQHEDEDFYTGVCAVDGEIMCLPKYEFEEK